MIEAVTNELSPTVTGLAVQLRALAKIVGNQMDPRPGSIAAHEFEDSSHSDTWGTRSLLDAWLWSGVLRTHATDHFIGMAATIDAPDTVLSTVSLLRPALLALARSYYLTDTSLAPVERIRRSMNLRLESLTERINLAVGDDAEREACRIQIHEIKVAASRARLPFNRSNRRLAVGLRKPCWLGAEPPRDLRLLEALIDDENDEPGYSPSGQIFRVSSAVIHAQSHGSSAFWYPSDEPSIDGVSTIQLGIDSRHLATLVGSALLASLKVMVRIAQAYGESPAKYAESLNPIRLYINSMIAG
jgi:hypothetical protein